MSMRRRGAYSLFELMMALGIFSLVILVLFLPFKIIRDAERTGSSRIDPQLALRTSLQKMLRDLRRGCLIELKTLFPPNAYGYDKITVFRDLNRTLRVSYYMKSIGVNEYALCEQTAEVVQPSGSVKRLHPERRIIPKGLRLMYLRPVLPSAGESFPDDPKSTDFPYLKILKGSQYVDGSWQSVSIDDHDVPYSRFNSELFVDSVVGASVPPEQLSRTSFVDRNRSEHFTTEGIQLKIYLQVYTDDVLRPLPSSPGVSGAKGGKVVMPMEFATSLVIRN